MQRTALDTLGMRDVRASIGALPQTGIGFFIFDDIAIAVGAIAGLIASAAAVVGLSSIISAGVCTAIATTFITSVTAALTTALTNLIGLGLDEIKKAINAGANAIYSKVDEEIAKVKPDWDAQTRREKAEPFITNIREVTEYLAGGRPRKKEWSPLLPLQLLPGTIDKLNKFQSQIVTGVLLKDASSAGFAVLATAYLTPYAAYGGDSELSTLWKNALKPFGGGGGPKYDTVTFDTGGATPAPVLTPEENFAAVAKSITDAGGKLVGDTSSWDFSNLPAMPSFVDTSVKERVDWTIAPFLNAEQRLKIAVAAVSAYPTFGGGMIRFNAVTYNRVAEFAGVLVDPATSVNDTIRWMVSDEPSQAGAALNAMQRTLGTDRNAAQAATTRATNAILKVPDPVVTVNAAGKVVVTKPKPNVATFTWGILLRR